MLYLDLYLITNRWPLAIYLASNPLRKLCLHSNHLLFLEIHFHLFNNNHSSHFNIPIFYQAIVGYQAIVDYFLDKIVQCKHKLWIYSNQQNKVGIIFNIQLLYLIIIQVKIVLKEKIVSINEQGILRWGLMMCEQ